MMAAFRYCSGGGRFLRATGERNAPAVSRSQVSACGRSEAPLGRFLPRLAGFFGTRPLLGAAPRRSGVGALVGETGEERFENLAETYPGLGLVEVLPDLGVTFRVAARRVGQFVFHQFQKAHRHVTTRSEVQIHEFGKGVQGVGNV